MKVNFFIIGAAKSGSTSLYHYLNQHPDIYFSPVKETNYFAKEIKTEKLSANYRKNNFIDMDSYFANKKMQELPLAIVQKPEHYEKLFRAVKEEKILAEASVSYMYSPVAADEIKAYNPDAKFMAILRSPAERAFSHYLMALRFGYTSLPFRQAFEADMHAPNKGWGVSELFYELGLYHQQLKKFYDRFPKENMQVHLFEDLHNNKKELFNSAFNFLGLEPVDINTEKVHNPGEVPKHPGLNKFIYRTGAAKLAGKILPGEIKSRIKNNMLENEKPQLSGEDRLYLNKLYQDEISACSDLIGRDLSHWLK